LLLTHTGYAAIRTPLSGLDHADALRPSSNALHCDHQFDRALYRVVRPCNRSEHTEKMRALAVHGSEAFSFIDTPELRPRAGEVLIDVVAAGICGTDLEILSGDMVYFTTGAARYPVVPGHEWTGVVRETGPDVTHLRPGDRVVGEVSIGCRSCSICLSGNYHRCMSRTETGILNRQGAFAERISLPAAFVHRISSDVPWRSAALIEPAAVAYNGVRRARVSPSDQVAVFGDGPIGLLLIQIARAFGARRIVGIGASDRRLAMAQSLGVHAVIDARSDDVIERLNDACGGTPPDVVFEASGNPSAIKTAISATAPGGRLILQGFCGHRRVDGLNFDPLIVKDVTIIGALGSPGAWPSTINLIESKRIDPSLIVTDELPIRSFAEAVRRLRTREAVKLVIRMDQSPDWPS
jgi:L-iditol 2-dehydrogenase